MHSVAVSLSGWSAERGAGRLDAEVDISEAEADGFEFVESGRRMAERTPLKGQEGVKASK